MRKNTLAKSICIAMGIMGMTMGTGLAAPVQVTSNTDLSWTKQNGTYQFANGLVFSDFTGAQSDCLYLGYDIDDMTVVAGDTLTISPTLKPNDFGAFGSIRVASVSEKPHVLNIQGGKFIAAIKGTAPSEVESFIAVNVDSDGHYDKPAQSIVNFTNKETLITAEASGVDGSDWEKSGVEGVLSDHNSIVNFTNDKTVIRVKKGEHTQRGGSGINVGSSMVNFNSKEVEITVENKNPEGHGDTMNGIRIQGGGVEVDDNWENLRDENGNTIEKYNTHYGVTFKGADKVSIKVTGGSTEDSLEGIYLIDAGYLTVDNTVKNFSIESVYNGPGMEESSVEGLSLMDTCHTFVNADNTVIRADASAAGDGAIDGYLAALDLQRDSTAEFGGKKLVLEAKNSPGGYGFGVEAYAKSTALINADDVTIKVSTPGVGLDQYNSMAATSEGGSIVAINSDKTGADQGKTVHVEGAVWGQHGGTIFLNLTNDSSKMTGWAAKDEADDSGETPQPEGRVDMMVENGARWDLTANSGITTLKGGNGGIVDMTVNPNAAKPYQFLEMDNLKGGGDVFIMDTDLDSQTDGDKIYIYKTAETGKHFIQVKDVSADKGAEVTGEKKLLLVKDASGNSVFEGQTYHGLWDTEPTVEKIGKDWYLVKVVHYDNPETETGVGNVESAYAFWRAGILDDTLRQRLGDVRYHKQDDGVWARFKTGKLQAPLYDGSYQMYQVGYDKRHNRDIYGIALDHTRGKTNHSMGQAKNRNIGITLYDTNYRDDNTYSDLVLRVGRIRNDLRMYDGKASNTGDMDYKVWGYSASYELGKTQRKDHGWFYEPQAQLIYGRLPGGTYHTNKGLKIRKDAIDSLLGRAGIVAGRQLHENSDFYIKANLYHEFLGDDDMYFELAGQKLHREIRHRDTWYNLGLGCNILLDKDVSVYGDVERTFHADIRKKWQANVGLRYGF